MPPEPAQVPVLEVVRAGQPEAFLGQPGHGQVAHQPAGRSEHRREADPTHAGQPPGQEVVEPGRGPLPGHLVAGVLGDLAGARGRPDRGDLLGHDRLGVRPPEGLRLHERPGRGRSRAAPRGPSSRYSARRPPGGPRGRAWSGGVARPGAPRSGRPSRSVGRRTGRSSREGSHRPRRRPRNGRRPSRRRRSRGRRRRSSWPGRARSRRPARTRPCNRRPPSSPGSRRPARPAGSRPG